MDATQRDPQHLSMHQPMHQQQQMHQPQMQTHAHQSSLPLDQNQLGIDLTNGHMPHQQGQSQQGGVGGSGGGEIQPIVPMSKQEAFLLTAADQPGGTRDERLARVIRSKYEAGLLKPYNYVHGYARLSRWMDRNLRPDSKQLILQPIQILRPKFSAIAKGLTDMDLVFIEEAFERMLLDYDRVFSAMGIPACLWRRTGEIYKGNKEFAELVGIDDGMLREVSFDSIFSYSFVSSSLIFAFLLALSPAPSLRSVIRLVSCGPRCPPDPWDRRYILFSRPMRLMRMLM
ncbi:hypothetical protein SISSUDRAFT_1056168 [Sistotremastrum suecicum HHB10207 ss-3]|uniref:PAS domain-containing protein n=1 Tax=Sistotremastrum suecicum HHB10207 ss-3 TaxID=1314776 RepID=A0A165X6I4_9AGAM|nr:hypothetical protein SISSUDRAFT_1056168 [Sistotremastrum suecicum HHB10207 ss-3]